MIVHKELQAALVGLGALPSDHDVDVMFHGSHMTHSSSMAFQHFLLCLCLASILRLIPVVPHGCVLVTQAHKDRLTHTHLPASPPPGTAVEEHKAPEGEAPAHAAEEPTAMKGRKLVDALHHAVEAYILFDEDGSGTIDRAEVMHTIREKNSSSAGESASGLLSEDRWKELDWDSDGTIRFKQLLLALMKWEDVKDDA